MRVRASILAALLIATLPLPCQGQTTVAQQGDALRALILEPMPYGPPRRTWVRGQFDGSDTDSLRFRYSNGGRFTLSRSAITDLQVRRGRKHPLVHDLVYGALVGAAGGAIIGFLMGDTDATYTENCGETDLGKYSCSTSGVSRLENVVGAGVVVGILGGTIGLVVGAVGRDHWVRVSLPGQ